MTFDWKDNEIRMSRYVTEHMRKIAEAMNPKAISVSVKNFGDHFNTRVYQTTHLLGGAIMGQRSEDQCAQPLPAELGRAQRSSWAPRPSPGHRLQPHWAGGGAGLLVGQGDPRAIPEEPRSAGAGMRSATMKPDSLPRPPPPSPAASPRPPQRRTRPWSGRVNTWPAPAIAWPATPPGTASRSPGPADGNADRRGVLDQHHP